MPNTSTAILCLKQSGTVTLWYNCVHIQLQHAMTDTYQLAEIEYTDTKWSYPSAIIILRYLA